MESLVSSAMITAAITTVTAMMDIAICTLSAQVSLNQHISLILRTNSAMLLMVSPTSHLTRTLALKNQQMRPRKRLIRKLQTVRIRMLPNPRQVAQLYLLPRRPTLRSHRNTLKNRPSPAPINSTNSSSGSVSSLHCSSPPSSFSVVERLQEVMMMQWLLLTHRASKSSTSL